MYTSLEERIGNKNLSLSDLVCDVVWQGMMFRGEAMFMLAWELRDNPSTLFKLPDPQ
jgi:hypothetical protein